MRRLAFRPGADVPTLQLSLIEGLDPAVHLRLGEAPSPLRSEGVFIVGSGMSFHNMQAFMSGPGALAAAPAEVAYNDDVLGTRVSAVHFG